MLSSRRLLHLSLSALLLTSCTSLRYAGINRMRNYDICSSDVPENFDGYRIAFASDFHLKSKFKERQLHGTAKALQHISPDVLLLGGDYQEGCEYIEPLFKTLTQTTPPDGIYAVLGNNDYERCTELIRSTMKEYGIRLLEQDIDTIRKGGQHILIWGANPYVGHYPTLPKTLQTANGTNKDDFVILLTHTPDYAEDCNSGTEDLALAGHTHGGQVTLFGLYAPITASKYGMRYRTGLKHTSKGTPIIISNGLGTSRRPIRLFAPTDVVIVTLRQKKSVQID